VYKRRLSTPSRILVIDDNPAIHEDFRKIFGCRDIENASLDAIEAAFFGVTEEEKNSSMNVEIDSAHQGKDGWQKVTQSMDHESPYTMAFVDMRMPPGWNGLTTIQKLWEADPSLHVVICSAYSDYSWDDIIREIGCSDQLMILKKPFDNSEVQQLAVAISEKRHAADAMRAAQQRSEDRAGEAERLLAAVDFFLIGLGEDGRIERWNTRAADLLGTPPDDALGPRLDELPTGWPHTAALPSFLAHQRCRAEWLGVRGGGAMEGGGLVWAAGGGAMPEVWGDAAADADPLESEAWRETARAIVNVESRWAAMRTKGFDRASALTWDIAQRRLWNVLEAMVA